ncbi:MAG: protoglobin domain-containing protein [Myxococcota bacterium]
MAVSRDLEIRLAYLGIDDEDRAALAALRPMLEEQADALVEAFYRHLLGFQRTRQLLRDEPVRKRLLDSQREYLLSLAGPEIDEDYVRHRRTIGEVHERIGLEPRWYLGAYALYLSLLTPMICVAYPEAPQRAEKAVVALQRILMLDAQLAIETYIQRSERDLETLNEELARAGRQLQTRYTEQNQALTQTEKRAQAAEALASIGTLVAGLAHEIGTPMGVIQGHAKLLERAVDDEKARWRLATITEQIARISKIIQSLLNMARPKASERIPVDLEALLESTLAFLTEKFQRRRIDVARSFAEVPSVLGDPERIQQLCLNLFINAADAMPDGGTLSIELAPLGDDEVLLRIADEGLGIPASELPHIFDPFYTSKDAGKGNGLGLTVASGIVNDHGGRIDVESEPGVGTEFRIALPCGGSEDGAS